MVSNNFINGSLMTVAVTCGLLHSQTISPIYMLQSISAKTSKEWPKYGQRDLQLWFPTFGQKETPNRRGLCPGLHLATSADGSVKDLGLRLYQSQVRLDNHQFPSDSSHVEINGVSLFAMFCQGFMDVEKNKWWCLSFGFCHHQS